MPTPSHSLRPVARARGAGTLPGILSAWIACGIWSAASAAAPYLGRSVEEVLNEARNADLTLIYSDQLVPRSLRVLSEPQARSGVELLNEVLSPHGLTLNPLGGNVYSVVRAATAPNPERQVTEVAPSPNQPLEEVVVTTSTYTLAGEQDAGVQLTQTEVHSLPRLGDETLRAVQRLPGAASNGLSGLASIRGGEPNETLILLDGLPLYEPFHLKNFFSPVSLLDSRMVATLDVYSGGYPAFYGDRMSAVIDAQSLMPPDQRYYELGVSLFHTNGLAAGTIDGGRGRWLLSARRSNLDQLVHVLESDFGEPEYFDVFARGSWDFERTSVAFNFLTSRDEVVARSESSGEEANVAYRNTYAWATLQHAWSEKLSGSAIASFTDVTNNRHGSVDDPGQRIGNVSDDRFFHVAGLQMELRYDSTHLLHRLGVEAKQLTADYTYSSTVRFDPTPLFPDLPDTEVNSTLDPEVEGWQYAAYWDSRLRLGEHLVADIGLRFDDQPYQHIDGVTQLAPRINLMYDFASGWRLRGGWGRFYQSQGINELQVEDGVDHFLTPQRADQMVIGVERSWPQGLRLRLEAYRKDYSQLKPRYENLFDPLVLLPELQPDRVRIAPSSAHSEGVELMLSYRPDSAWSGWLSYSWSQARDEIDGGEVPRSWDQRHSINAGLRWTKGLWEATLVDSYHTGWPTTAVTLQPATDDQGNPVTVPVVGPRNMQRLDAFNSLDLRVSRRFPLSRGELETYVEVSNLIGRENPCCTDYTVVQDANGTHLDADTDYWLGTVPSVGVLWKY